MTFFDENDLFFRLLKFEEGYNEEAHLVDDKWHIAYGHLLQRRQSKEELAILGIDKRPASWEGFTVNEQQGLQLLEIGMRKAIAGAETIFEDIIDDLSETRRVAIQSMCYQMGTAGVELFENFIDAVEEGDWETASKEMLDSKWAKNDSPARANRASEAMKSDYFEDLNKPSIPPQGEDEEEPFQTSDYDLNTELDIKFGAINDRLDEFEKRFEVQTNLLQQIVTDLERIKPRRR